MLFNAENYSFPSLEEACETLDSINEQIELFGELTIADFKSISGYDSDIHSQDYDYGWTDISEASVENSIGGYYIDMPVCFKF